MKNRLTLQQRLILPIVLLGLITLLSNILAVFGIHNVNANAGIIVDRHMVSEAQLEDIRRSMMEIHRLALSHIIAADHATMIQLVGTIKEEEAGLDEKLAAYASCVPRKRKKPTACFWKITTLLSTRSSSLSVPVQTAGRRRPMRRPTAT